MSVWLARQGLEVLAVDVSPVAIGAARWLASAHAVPDSIGAGSVHGETGSVDFEVVDLDTGLPSGPFDLVVCQRFRDPDRYADLAAAVAPGGLLVITVLSTVGHAGDPGPFRADPGELIATFGSELEILWSAEADGESHLVARRR